MNEIERLFDELRVEVRAIFPIEPSKMGNLLDLLEVSIEDYATERYYDGQADTQADCDCENEYQEGFQDGLNEAAAKGGA